MSLSFISSFAWRWSFGLLNGDRRRPIDAVGRPTIFVFHFGRSQIRGARHWGGKSACMAFFFLVWEQFLSVEVIEEEKKAGKRQSSSDRWMEGSREKKSSSALDTRSKIDQTQGRASRAIDRAPAPERPRLRYDLRNRRPGSPCTAPLFFTFLTSNFQLCLSFWASSFDLVLFKKFSLGKKYPKNHPKCHSSYHLHSFVYQAEAWYTASTYPSAKYVVTDFLISF